MFKFFAICFFAIFALAAAKPQVLAYSAYTSPYVAAPYTAAYASPYVASYAASPYVAAPYAAAYSAYPYSAAYLLRK